MNDQPESDGREPEADAGMATPSWASLLAAVEIPVAARETAIGAALTEYDHVIASTEARPDTVGAEVIDLAARRRRTRLLGAAAAVLIVGGAAAVGFGSRANDDAPLADGAALATARTETAPAAESFAAPEQASVPVTIGAIDGPASADAAGDTPLLQDDAADAPATLDDGPLLEIDSPQALAAYAASIAPGTGVGAVAGSTCVAERTEMLGLVLYQGNRAVVGRDISGVVVALDATTCVMLDSVTP